MSERPPLAPRRSDPGSPSPQLLAAVKAAGRRRVARTGFVVASALATATIVGAAALAAGAGGAGNAQPGTTSAPAPGPTSLQQYDDAEDACLRAKGVTVSTEGGGRLRSYKPQHEDDPGLDDLIYQCELELQAQGWRVVPRSPEPGPDIAQVLEIRFKPGTYTDEAQRAVNACYQRKGVTPLPSSAPSPPSQRFRFVGSNVAEGHVIFDCLSVIPGVVVVDVPKP